MWQLADDTINAEDLDALAQWLASSPRLTQGELVQSFEREWSAWVGGADSVMVSSGTTANLALLMVAARSLKRRPPRVGVSAVTWATNVTPALLLGHEVVVFDIEQQTLGVNREQVCTAMENGAIDILFVTHLLGFNALDTELLDCAARNGVQVLEDCCEAIGATSHGQFVGTLGLAGTYSFYYGHHMSTIEGGMITTMDDVVADELRLVRAHGLARESGRSQSFQARHPELDPAFLFVRSGLNFRSTDLNAFLGLRQLTTIPHRVRLRNDNLSVFLESLPQGYWKDFRTEGASSFALPLIGMDDRFAATALETVRALGIETRPVVAGNLMRQPFMEDHANQVTVFADTTVADHVHDFGIYVGNGHHVNEERVRTLTAALQAAAP